MIARPEEGENRSEYTPWARLTSLHEIWVKVMGDHHPRKAMPGEYIAKYFALILGRSLVEGPVGTKYLKAL